MATDKDYEQDALIRQNAENIRQNQEAIRRQTEALEKIRDHYFPKKTLWKSASGLFLKAVGAVTVAAGLLEAADWFWNTRQADSMAAESAAVAKRLFFQENDAAGAMKFLEKAIELKDDVVKYRIALAYMKGFAAIGDLYDLGRPLTAEERVRLDEILAEAVYLQETSPDEAMPYVLAAQVRMLRGEKAESVEAIARAVRTDPENVQARVSACAVNFAAGNVSAAREQLSVAERLRPDFPLVLLWKVQLAWALDHDRKTALSLADALIRRAPRQVMAHVLKGRVLLAGEAADVAAARASFERALVLSPDLTRAMVPMAESYVREGNGVLARLWLDRALAKDPNCMAALVARARLGGPGAAADLTQAISIAPFRADLYRLRAATYGAARPEEAAADLKVAEAIERETRQ